MQPAVNSFEWVRFSTGPGAPDRLGSPLMAKRRFNRWIGAVLPWSAPPLALGCRACAPPKRRAARSVRVSMTNLAPLGSDPRRPGSRDLGPATRSGVTGGWLGSSRRASGWRRWLV